MLSPQGRLLKEMKLQLKNMSNQQVNISDLVSGTYFISITDVKGYKQTVKLIIAY
jgi:hypothetical protein